MRVHWHRIENNLNLEFLSRAKYNIVKMMTPPKKGNAFSGSNMFRDWVGNKNTGQTGIFQKPAKILPWLASGAGGILGTMVGGPVGGMIGGALGGGLTQGLQGATTNLYGKGQGWQEGLSGALQGAGIGGIMGMGMTGGFQSFADKIQGFGKPAAATGMQSLSYAGTPYIGSGQSASLAPGMGVGSNFGMTGSASNILSGANIAQSAGMVGGANIPSVASQFNLNNVMKMVTGVGSMAMGAPKADPEKGRSLVESPDLEQARGMIRDLALMKPEEVVGPASDEWFSATLRQNRDAAERQKQYIINEYSKRGKTVGKSGGLDKQLLEYDKQQIQREQDFIVQVNESRRIAALGNQIKAVQSYFNVSEQEAADMLAAEGYMDPQDAANYLSMKQNFNTLYSMF